MNRKKIDPPYEIRGINFLGDHHLQITELSSDELLLTMTVNEEHINLLGMAQGGVMFTLADVAAWYMTVESSGRICLTLSSNLNYIKPAYPGKLEALARMEHLGKKTSVVHVDVMQKNDIISTATFTFYLTDTPTTIKEFLMETPTNIKNMK